MRYKTKKNKKHIFSKIINKYSGEITIYLILISTLMLLLLSLYKEDKIRINETLRQYINTSNYEDVFNNFKELPDLDLKGANLIIAKNKNNVDYIYEKLKDKNKKRTNIIYINDNELEKDIIKYISSYTSIYNKNYKNIIGHYPIVLTKTYDVYSKLNIKITDNKNNGLYIKKFTVYKDRY